MTRDLPVVTVDAFPGGFSWSIFVGRDKGMFAAYGIAVALQATPDSVTQIRAEHETAWWARENCLKQANSKP
jgi:ABC-type nitrate/sulfonate/bicarbonate transport system substrate-binding protein